MVQTETLMTFIKLHVQKTCELLAIDTPEIKIDDSRMRTATQLASVEIYTDKTIYLRSSAVSKFDIYFAIAHELRHIWQAKSPAWRLELNTRRSNDQSSVEYYNNQMSEIDANAYAGLYMMNMFKVKPLFNGLDKSTKEKIFKRMETIAKELKVQSRKK